MTIVAAVPLVRRPWCSSVAGSPVPVARRVRWAAGAVAALVVLVAMWPGHWWGVAALLLPDLPLLLPRAWAQQGRLRPWVVPVYNAAHALAGPVVLLAIGAAVGAGTVVGVAAGWLVHVAVDRAAGYDLRNSSGALRR